MKKEIKKNNRASETYGTPLGIQRMAIIGTPEGQKRDKGVDRVSEDTMAKNFPNLTKNINLQSK